MATQLACVYTITSTGPATNLSTRLAAVTLPLPALQQQGLRFISDSTVALARTVTLGIDASTLALATPNLQVNSTGIASVTVGTKGQDYVVPPVAVVTPGTSKYVVRTAKVVAELGMVLVNVVAGGMSYSAQTIIQASGGSLANGGVQASAVPTIGGGGSITGTSSIVAGGPYWRIPTLTAVDPTGAGSGAILTASLGVVQVAVIDPGEGYDASAGITITGFFQSLYPSNALKVAAVTDFFTQALEQGTESPVVASTPVLS